MKSTWPTKKLGEVCEELKIEKAPVGATPYIEIGDVNIETKEINLKEKGGVKGSIFAPADCVIVSRVRPTRGAVALLNKKIIISSAFTILKPKAFLDLKFLFYYLAHNPNFFEYLGKRQKGSNYPSCREKDVLDFEISLPPLKIQKRIVARIEEFFEKIDKAKELRQKAQEETAAIFLAALQENFSKAEKKWEKKKLGDQQIANITSGGTPKRGVEKYYSEGTIPWLKSGELNDNENITDSEEHITEIALKESSAKIFPINTILIAMYGATVGKVGILKKPAATNQAIAGIKPNEEIIDYKFLFNYLIWKRNFFIWRSFGGAQPNISQIIIKKLEIPLPPISEQKKIVAYLDDLREKAESLKQLQQNQLEELDELKSSILSKAFKGEIL